MKLKDSKKGYMRGRRGREESGVITISKIAFTSICYLIIPLRFFFYFWFDNINLCTVTQSHTVFDRF